MKKPEHTQENIEQLAETVVEGMELDDLMMLAKDQFEETYKNNFRLFEEDWENFISDT